MPLPSSTSVVLNSYLSELALLDVVDVRPDGTLCLNEGFIAECMGVFDDDPACLGTVFQDRIVARAVERGYAGCVDADELALAALELGAAEEENPRA